MGQTDKTIDMAIGIMLLLLGCATTYQFIEVLLGDAILAISITAIVQMSLTKLQGMLWAKGSKGIVRVLGVVSLLFDTLLNVAGIWVFLPNLENTALYKLLYAAGFGMSYIYGIVLIVFCMIVSIAPEILIFKNK